MKVIVNAVAFQVGWFICVLLQGWWAWAYVGSYLLLHLFFIGSASELKFIVVATLLGTLVDSILIWFGIFDFGENHQVVCPPWLIALWVLFATTFYHALAWLKNYRRVAILFGAIGGCASYFAGYKFGAVSFTLPISSTLIIVALIWAILFPALQYLAKMCDI